MALTNRDILHKYLRHSKKFPHIWCPGCGNGIVLAAFLRAVDTTGWTKDEIVMASGIGCAARSPVYVDFNTLHTAHGRALTFATGIKAAKPKMKVVVMTGDGDAVGIGGNHFIHACRRNIDITAIIINNMVYGMTGGQQSPTTPLGAKTTTAQHGVAEQPFDIAELAVASGATFVARATTYHAKAMENLIKKALNHKGFSVVEVISQAPVCYGRRNGIASAAAMMQIQRDMAISMAKAKDMSFEERRAHIVTGVLMERDMKEWTESYAEVRQHAGWKGDD
jgi:2-oxoglutarate ferredoxin oxidoreductase subunit beta